MEKDTLSTAVSEPVILRNGSQPSIKGPDAWFTGTVRIDPLFPAHTPARASSAYVTFEPGARTAWHTHPLGQAQVITAGVRGRGGRFRRSVLAIRSGSLHTSNTGTEPLPALP